MTVASEINRSGPYNGNGVTTAFDYDFRILNQAHVSVILTDADGVESTLTLTTDYSVTGVRDAGGGQIVMVTAPAVGETVTVIRNVPFVQETDLENQGAYNAEDIEDALDAAVMRDQQLEEQVNRSIKVGVSQDIDDLDTFVRAIVNMSGRLLLPAAADPSTRDDGSALVQGDIYYNTTDDAMRTWSGSAWADIAEQSLNMTANSFVGDGTETDFTLSRIPAVASNVMVWVGGVRQKPTTDYTVSGTTLTLLVAPSNGVEVDTLVVTTSSQLNAPADESVELVTLSPSLAQLLPVSAATRSVLKAFDTNRVKRAFLSDGRRAGFFSFLAGNYSTQIAADTLEGVYIKADAVAATAGAWVRERDPDVWEPGWFGAVFDAATNDGPVYAVIHTLAKNGDTILMPIGLSGIVPANRIQFTKALSIIGRSKNASGFYGLGFSTDVAILEDQGTTGDRIQNIRRENFAIRSNNSLARGWNATWVNKSSFKNLYFYDLYNGYAGDNAWSIAWENCDGYGISKSQIIFFDECNHNTMTNCAFVGHRGIRILGSGTSLALVNPDFEGIISDAGTPGAGLMVQPTTGKKFRGITITNIYAETIDGFVIQTSPVDAFAVEALSVKGGYIYGRHANADWAFSLSDLNGFEFSELKFEDWDVAAFVYTTTAINGRIANNVCDTGTVPALTSSANLMHYSVEIINNTYGRKVSWDTAQPSSGSYTQGDYVHNIAPSLDGNSQTLKGWIRLTTGSGHVSGTDWANDYAEHLSPG